MNLNRGDGGIVRPRYRHPVYTQLRSFELVNATRRVLQAKRVGVFSKWSRSASGSPESSSGREGGYGYPPREEGCVDVVLILLSAPQSIGSTSTLPREVDLTLAQLELLLFLPCLGRLELALKLRGLGGAMSPQSPVPGPRCCPGCC
jgi:hypothetical protein